MRETLADAFMRETWNQYGASLQRRWRIACVHAPDTEEERGWHCCGRRGADIAVGEGEGGGEKTLML
jgi:hypothetical protein